MFRRNEFAIPGKTWWGPVPTSLYVPTSLHANSLSFVKMEDYSKFNLTLKNLFEFQKIKYSKPVWVAVLVGDQSVHNICIYWK